MTSPKSAYDPVNKLPSYSAPIVGISSQHVRIDSNCIPAADEKFETSLYAFLTSNSNGLIARGLQYPALLGLVVQLDCNLDVDDEDTEFDELMSAITGLSLFPTDEYLRYKAVLLVYDNLQQVIQTEEQFSGIITGERSGFYVGSMVAARDLYAKLGTQAGEEIAVSSVLSLNSVGFIRQNANLTNEQRLEQILRFLETACVAAGRTVEIVGTGEVLSVSELAEGNIVGLTTVKITERRGFDYIASEYIAQQSFEIRECMRPYIDRILNLMI